MKASLLLLLSAITLALSFKANAQSFKSYLVCQGQNTGYHYQIFPQFGEIYAVNQKGESVMDMDSLSNASENGFTVDLFDYEDESYITNIVPIAPGKYVGKVYAFVQGGDAVLCQWTKSPKK